MLYFLAFEEGDFSKNSNVLHLVGGVTFGTNNMLSLCILALMIYALFVRFGEECSTSRASANSFFDMSTEETD